MNETRENLHVYGRLFVEMVAILALTFLITGLLFAEERPLSQLPDDVASLATGWMAIPQQMAEVGQDDGVLAGLSYGPIKGSTRLFSDTTEILKQNEASYGSGKLLSYTF